MNRILLVIIILCINVGVNATPHSTVTLKNGSEIKGDIVVQRIGNDLTIEAENAILVIDPKDIVSKKARKVKYENLSREMKRWVLKNKALKGDAYGRYVELVDIQTKKYFFSGLTSRPQNEASKTTYVQATPTTFNIKWNDIQSIDKNTSDDIKYELTDRVTTFTGKKYKGRIISQKNGVNVTIATSNGQVIIPNKEIKEIVKKKPEGESKSYFNHVDFTNVVVLKNSTEKEGLITEHHYGKKPKDNYITLLKTDGKPEVILNSVISEFRTKYNTNNKRTYTPGKVYLNEFKIEKARFQRLSDNVVFIDKQVFPFPEGIKITFKSEGNKLSGNWSLVSLSEVPTSNGKSSRGYNVTKKKDNTIPSSSSDLQSIIRQINYEYLTPGYYALVNDSDSEAYVFKIIK